MAANPNRPMTATEWALLLFLSLLWGGSFFYNAIAVTALGTFTIVAVRVGLGSLFLYAVLRLTGARLPRDTATWRAFAVMGILNNVIPFSLIAWGQASVPSGLASILNATTPIFTVIVAHYTTSDERMTPLRVGGIVAGFAGVIVMIGGDVLAKAGNHLPGEIAIIVASVSYAFSAIYGRRFARMGLAPLATATGQIAAAAAMMIPLAIVIDMPWLRPLPGLPVWGALLGLGAISTCLAYVVYYRILATAGAVNLMLVTLLIPVTAILLGAVVLGERLAVNHFVGMAAIALGLLAIDGRVFRLFARRA
jgi:drug/metabolite transporter (DMT)-like permease